MNYSLIRTKQILRLMLVLFCTLFVAVFAVRMVAGHVFAIDELFIRAAYKVRVEWLTVIVKVFTNLGSVLGIILLTLAMVILIKDWKLKIFAVFNVGMASIVNLMVKYIVKRPRPDVVALIVERGYSFPSGHSMLAMAVFGYIAYVIYKTMKNKGLKLILGFLSCLIGVLIALSRVYLGVHYFSDIVCGLVLGLAVLVVSIMGHKAMLVLEDKRKNLSGK